MVDEAHDWTDEQIAALEDRMRGAYEQAVSEMSEKLKQFLADFDEKNAEMKSKVASGETSQEAYDDWLKYQSNQQVWIGKMAEELAADATRVDQLAMDYINDELPNVYCENVNYSFYGIETEIGFDTHSFTLYDQKTVALMLADPDAIRYPNAELDEEKDSVWNFRKMNEAITQSILQGESIPKTAKRLTAIVGNDMKIATRVARTVMTSAENAGRVESYRVADKVGVRVHKQWMATLDLRTRPSHRLMNNVHIPYDKPFVVGPNGAKMMHPADPKGPAEEVYNCRCTLVGWVEGIEDEDPEQWSDLPKGMTYEQWLGAKQNDQAKQVAVSEPVAKPKKKPAYTSKSSKLWTQLGKADPDSVRGKVEGMLKGASGKAALLWKKFEDKLTYADPVHKNSKGKTKGAYFSPNTWIHSGEHQFGVHMNLDFAMTDKVKGELATWFHEFGHHIDFASREGSWYATGDNHWEFGKVIADEVDEYISSRQSEWSAKLNELKSERDLSGILDMGFTNSWAKKYGKFHETAQGQATDDAWLYQHKMGYIVSKAKTLEERRQLIFEHYAKTAGVPTGKKLSIQQVRDKIGRDITNAGLDSQLAVGDIFEGATKGKCKDTYGHGKGYWNANNSKLAKEAFAEFFSAECVYSNRPQILDIMKEMLPKSYQAYQGIVEGLLK